LHVVDGLLQYVLIEDMGSFMMMNTCLINDYTFALDQEPAC